MESCFAQIGEETYRLRAFKIISLLHLQVMTMISGGSYGIAVLKNLITLLGTIFLENSLKGEGFELGGIQSSED